MICYSFHHWHDYTFFYSRSSSHRIRMADSGSSIVSTKVLGKRKHSESLVLHFSSASSYAPSESEFEEPIASTIPLRLQPPSCRSPLKASNPKTLRFKCTYTGCDKAYKKRSRLEEHERSHTGERPFVCRICEKSYLRETHLQAHARSHLPTSDRPFACSDNNCNKRFWTRQHLQVHIEKVHNGEKIFKCTASGCDEAFAKHHQLRTHYVQDHTPPGTKPYICNHSGCEKSFATNQKLKAHVKVHDKERYTCSHPDCLARSIPRSSEWASTSRDLSVQVPASSTTANSIQYFPNWTSLQAHLRTDHPPTCAHPDCINPTTGKSKTFTTRASLRTHMKIHDLRDREAALALEADDEQEDGGGSDEEDERADSRSVKKPRRGGELGRDFICTIENCGKDFKSKQALNTHNSITHLGRRDFRCEFPGCAKTYGYRRLLVKHMAKHRRSHSPGAEADDVDLGDHNDDKNRQRTDSTFNPADLTGATYASRPTSFVRCPYPNFHSLIPYLPEHYRSNMQDRDQEDCEYTFRRAYDLRRHLCAVHDVELDKAVVDRWAARVRSSHP